jgi:hypothetical protein
MAAIAELRLRNTYLLLEEFKAAEGPSERLLRGADQAFAEYLQISPSHWSQLKGGHRSIGHTLARQLEARCGKPVGWLDMGHDAARPSRQATQPAAPAGPQTADERFAVDLFLTAYRANPAAVKARLLDVVHAELAKAQVTSKVRPMGVAKSSRSAKAA